MDLNNTERVNKLVTKITGDLHEKFKDYHPGRIRSDEMITYLVRELAFERIKNEILKE